MSQMLLVLLNGYENLLIIKTTVLLLADDPR
jgi:hypothetical protein